MKWIFVRKTELKIFNLLTYFSINLSFVSVSPCAFEVTVFSDTTWMLFMHHAQNFNLNFAATFILWSAVNLVFILTNLCGSDAASPHRMNTVWRLSIWDIAISPEIIHAVPLFDFRTFKYLFSGGKFSSNWFRWENGSNILNSYLSFLLVSSSHTYYLLLIIIIAKLTRALPVPLSYQLLSAAYSARLHGIFIVAHKLDSQQICSNRGHYYETIYA